MMNEDRVEDERDDDQRDALRQAETPHGFWVLERASDPKFPFRQRIYTPGR